MDELINQTSAFEVDLLTPLLKSLALIGAISTFLFFAIWWLKKNQRVRWTNTSSQKEVFVLERTDLSLKSSLYLIEVDGRRILIGESEKGLHLLERLSLDPSDSVN